MTRPPTRLFHLHYNTPDVGQLESALETAGLPLYRRFGWAEDDLLALSPTDPVPAGWRLYVETLQQGYANLTLGLGGRFRFDHLGIYASEFDAIVERAEAAGWSVRDKDGRRPFLTTPWRFRIEIHPEGDDVEGELGCWADAHLEEIRLVVPDAAPVRRGLDAVLGPVSGLVVEEGEATRPIVPRFTLGGTRFPDRPVVNVQTIAHEQDIPLGQQQ